MLDLRFECESCHVKWFVPGTRRADRDATDCAACGGRLIPLEHAENRPAPPWSVDGGQ